MKQNHFNFINFVFTYIKFRAAIDANSNKMKIYTDESVGSLRQMLKVSGVTYILYPPLLPPFLLCTVFTHSFFHFLEFLYFSSCPGKSKNNIICRTIIVTFRFAVLQHSKMISKHVFNSHTIIILVILFLFS